MNSGGHVSYTAAKGGATLTVADAVSIPLSTVKDGKFTLAVGCDSTKAYVGLGSESPFSGTNGPQLFYGLRYWTHIVKPNQVKTYHDQVAVVLNLIRDRAIVRHSHIKDRSVSLIPKPIGNLRCHTPRGWLGGTESDQALSLANRLIVTVYPLADDVEVGLPGAFGSRPHAVRRDGNAAAAQRRSAFLPGEISPHA